MQENTSNESKTGSPKTPNRQGLYAVAAVYTKEAIETLAELMRNSKNDSVRMGAARALLDKALPDLKAIEVSGEDNTPLKILIVEDKPKIIDGEIETNE